MKRYLFIACLVLALASRCFAQWAVIDAANLQQSVMNYAAMTEQLARQAEQVSNQMQQIRQMEDQLARLGRMADVKVIVGFPQFKLNLTLPTKLKTWADSLVTVDGYGLFGDTRGGIFDSVVGEFPDFDGTPIPRDPMIYKPVHDITTKVDNFKDVQVDVYTRRESLKMAIAETSEALRVAETEAEEKKLEAILNAQYSQLDALDSEVVLSAAEIQVKAAEADAMEDANNTATAETRAKLAQQEARKIGATFKPNYDSILRYLNETRYTP